MIQPNKKKAHPAANKTQAVLIEKSQIDNPQLDKEMEKILSNIISSIKNSPPAQPRKRYQKGNGESYSIIASKKMGALNSKAQLNLDDNFDPIKLLAQIQTTDTQQNPSLQAKDKQPPISNTNLNTQSSYNENMSRSIPISAQSQSKTPVIKHTSPNNLISQKTSNKDVSHNNLPNKQHREQQRKRSRPKWYNKAQGSAMVAKKFISNETSSKSKHEKPIDLDSQEQIIEVCIGNNQKKKKAELQLIMQYNEKTSLLGNEQSQQNKQTNRNQLKLSKQSQANMGGSKEELINSQVNQ